jgi:hypothetical protein
MIDGCSNDVVFDAEAAATPRVVIEEVNSTGDDLSQPSRWTPRVLLENEDSSSQPSVSYYSTKAIQVIDTTIANNDNATSIDGILHYSPRLLESGPLWNPSRSIEYVGGGGDDDDDGDDDDYDDDADDDNDGCDDDVDADVDEWSLA